VLVTTGFTGASRADMEPLPALSLICCVGTGYENVDVAAARERGIVVVHGASINAGAVADHPMTAGDGSAACTRCAPMRF
jgi:lactate dehydrogenase-like 2-hydroxyacid dehydrogenase